MSHHLPSKLAALERCMITAGMVVSFSAAPARADLGDELFKLTAADAAALDNFGYSVALSGNTAIVGSPLDNDTGFDSGSAYLFDGTTGNELFKLTASDAADDEWFGWSVGINGSTAIVGAIGDADAGLFTGSAYLLDVTTGNELFKLTASDAADDDFFGFSVAVSGNTAIVGAPGDGDAGFQSGSAYLFDVSTGNELFKLTASDAAAEEFFGWSVAISGNTAIVAAVGDNAYSGSAYLFDVTTGNELLKLTASDAAVDEYFGWSVAISGDTAIVGAVFGDGAVVDAGSAYLFDVTTGSELSKPTASDATEGDSFGYSVAISGNTAVIGSPADGDAGEGSGSAYLFDATTGSELLKLTASDAAAGDVFGSSVAISSRVAVVGAYLDDDAGDDSGSAYVFSAVPEPASVILLSAAAGLGMFIMQHRLLRTRGGSSQLSYGQRH